MSHHVAVCGVATATGLYARCGDGWRKLEPTRTPIAQLTPCRWCGEVYGCDCQDWLEWMMLAQPVEFAQEESSND